MESVLLALFIGGLAWVPFWLGSNRLLPWGINAVIFPGMLVVYELFLIFRGMPHPVPVRYIRIPAGLFVIATTWIVIQNATWTPSDWHHPIWQLAADALGKAVAGSISVDRDLTTLALMRLLTSASVFWLALQFSRDIRNARTLLWSVVVIEGAYAAVGLLFLAYLPDVAPFNEIDSGTYVSSTFVNRNHYGTFAGIGFVIIIGLIQQLYRHELFQERVPLRMKIATFLGITTERAALPIAFGFLILAALFLTGSRGAVISTGFGLVVLLVLNLRRARHFGWSEAILATFVALIAGGIFLAFGDRFVGRVEEQGIIDQTRLVVSLITVQSILSSPLLGYGYGTFAAVFPMFRDGSFTIWIVFDKLHDTYLEVLQGLGLLFGAMLIASVVLLVLRCLRGASRQYGGTIPAVAVSASVLVGVHAWVDFSLQIQAVTLTYMAVLGIGVAQSTDLDATPANS
jgi:O-antigen ligase